MMVVDRFAMAGFRDNRVEVLLVAGRAWVTEHDV
jgi:hypothetical protein